jgi:hypothetical protein
MTPYDIKLLIEEHFTKEIEIVKLKAKAGGYAFYLRPKQGGNRSNRVLRAKRERVNSATEIKFPISARLREPDTTATGAIDRAALIARVQREVELYRQHFAESASAK